jgi:hypothetical protein
MAMAVMNMGDLISGLEMIAAFLLTPVVLTLLMIYCEKYLTKRDEIERNLPQNERLKS